MTERPKRDHASESSAILRAVMPMRAACGVLCLLVCSLVATSCYAQTQPAGKIWRIGFLSVQTPAVFQTQLNAFRQKLRDLGYVEGQTLVMVDLILTPDGTPPTLAAKAASKKIPIIFFAGDAVESGLVASLARPGGNLTGVSGLTAGLDTKRLEILKEVVPGATRVAILWNPENLTGVPQRNRIALAAETLGVEPRILEARSPGEIDNAFAVAVREQSNGMLVLADPSFTNQRSRIAGLAVRARLPLAAYFRSFAEAGALVSYGPDTTEIFRRLAVYVDKILKGAKPADLPVEEPTKYELVINLKTASALGLTIPQSVVLRADQIIQ
jgi:putative ABC transport system substrate-binding protein